MLLFCFIEFLFILLLLSSLASAITFQILLNTEGEKDQRHTEKGKLHSEEVQKASPGKPK